MLEFSYSSRGAKELIVNGFIFQKSKTNPFGNTVYWKCNKYRSKENFKCPASCLTSSIDVTGTLLNLSDDHNHTAEPVILAIKKGKNEILKRLQVRSEKTPLAKIYTSEITKSLIKSNIELNPENTSQIRKISKKYYNIRKNLKNVKFPRTLDDILAEFNDPFIVDQEPIISQAVKPKETQQESENRRYAQCQEVFNRFNSKMSQVSTEQYKEMIAIFTQLTESSEKNTFNEFKQKHRFEFKEYNGDLISVNLSLSTAAQTSINQASSLNCALKSSKPKKIVSSASSRDYYKKKTATGVLPPKKKSKIENPLFVSKICKSKKVDIEKTATQTPATIPTTTETKSQINNTDIILNLIDNLCNFKEVDIPKTTFQTTTKTPTTAVTESKIDNSKIIDNTETPTTIVTESQIDITKGILSDIEIEDDIEIIFLD